MLHSNVCSSCWPCQQPHVHPCPIILLFPHVVPMLISIAIPMSHLSRAPPAPMLQHPTPLQCEETSSTALHCCRCLSRACISITASALMELLGSLSHTPEASQQLLEHLKNTTAYDGRVASLSTSTGAASQAQDSCSVPTQHTGIDPKPLQIVARI